jgi:hypothetical protein
MFQRYMGTVFTDVNITTLMMKLGGGYILKVLLSLNSKIFIPAFHNTVVICFI